MRRLTRNYVNRCTSISRSGRPEALPWCPRRTPRPFFQRPELHEGFSSGASEAHESRQKERPGVCLLSSQSLRCTYYAISYKHRVVCFLLSHVNATPLEAVRIGLLDTIATISDKSRLQILLPTFEQLTSGAAQDQTSISEGLATRIMSTFDAAVAPYLNDNVAAWDTFVLVIRKYLSSGVYLSLFSVLSAVLTSMQNLPFRHSRHCHVASKEVCLPLLTSSVRRPFVKSCWK